jgi:hypothetical protein
MENDKKYNGKNHSILKVIYGTLSTDQEDGNIYFFDGNMDMSFDTIIDRNIKLMFPELYDFKNEGFYSRMKYKQIKIILEVEN